MNVLLDYDGTLVPFAPTPSQAVPDEELRRLLDKLARRPRTHVAIVSGRDPFTMNRWFGDLPLTLRAEHGAWTRESDPGGPWTASVQGRPRALATATDHLRAVARRRGGFVEFKQSSAAWHYRGLAVSEVDVIAVMEELRSSLVPIGFDVVQGACVVEARIDGAHKGRAVVGILQRRPGTTIVAIGDDATDEDMFRALPAGREGILVGDVYRATGAAYRLTDHIAVRQFLSELVA